MLGSPYPAASPHKAGASGVGHSPGKQSASLGRATAGAVGGGDGKGVGVGIGGSASGVGVGGGPGGVVGGMNASGNGTMPRRNSLGDPCKD